MSLSADTCIGNMVVFYGFKMAAADPVENQNTFNSKRGIINFDNMEMHLTMSALRKRPVKWSSGSGQVETRHM